MSKGSRGGTMRTQWERIYVALGSLVAGLALGCASAYFFWWLILLRSMRRGHFSILRAPWRVHGSAAAFGIGWAVVNWVQGLREEKATRERLERLRARSEARARMDVGQELKARLGRPEA